jgi:hypothetical protein
LQEEVWVHVWEHIVKDHIAFSKLEWFPFKKNLLELSLLKITPGGKQSPLLARFLLQDYCNNLLQCVLSLKQLDQKESHCFCYKESYFAISDGCMSTQYLSFLQETSLQSTAEQLMPNGHPQKILGSTNAIIQISLLSQQVFVKEYRFLRSCNMEASMLKCMNQMHDSLCPKVIAEYFTRVQNDYIPVALVTEEIPKSYNLYNYLQQTKTIPIKSIFYNLGITTAKMHYAIKELPCVFTNQNDFRKDIQELWQKIQLKTLQKGNQSTELQSIFEQISNLSFDPSVCKLTNAQWLHGDYHLGQVLIQEDEKLVIIDFEGEPLSENSQWGPIEKDLAGMLRSFHYLAIAINNTYEDAQLWSEIFLESYTHASNSTINDQLLHQFLILKCSYEILYELNMRPQMAHIPITGMRSILKEFHKTNYSNSSVVP